MKRQQIFSKDFVKDDAHLKYFVKLEREAFRKIFLLTWKMSLFRTFRSSVLGKKEGYYYRWEIGDRSFSESFFFIICNITPKKKEHFSIQKENSKVLIIIISHFYFFAPSNCFDQKTKTTSEKKP